MHAGIVASGAYEAARFLTTAPRQWSAAREPAGAVPHTLAALGKGTVPQTLAAWRAAIAQGAQTWVLDYRWQPFREIALSVVTFA